MSSVFIFIETEAFEFFPIFLENILHGDVASGSGGGLAEEVAMLLFDLSDGEALVIDVDLGGPGVDVQLYLGGNEVIPAALAAVEIIEAHIATFSASHA